MATTTIPPITSRQPSRLTRVSRFGQSVWIDWLSRDLLSSGEVTTKRAVTAGHGYAGRARSLGARGCKYRAYLFHEHALRQTAERLDALAAPRFESVGAKAAA